MQLSAEVTHEIRWRLEDEEEPESHLHELEYKVENDLRDLQRELTPDVETTLKDKWEREGWSKDDLRDMLNHLKTLLTKAT